MKLMLLRGASGELVRPAELGVVDFFSGHRFAVHRRPIYLREDGTKDHIKETEMRFLAAAVLRTQGYSPRGTEWVVELGTAAIRKTLATFLHEHSGGLITVRDAGITGREQAIAGWQGRGGGNPRHKARTESVHNLLQNEAGAMLAATGHDRNPPEWLHGLERETQRVLKWISALPPEKAELLRAPVLEYWQGLQFLAQIDQQIATRTDHRLEGWEECGHTTVEYRLDVSTERWLSQQEFLALPGEHQQRLLAALEVMPPGLCARARKLCPLEVWSAGAGELIRFPDHVVALMFCDRALGDDLRRSKRLTAEGEFSVEDRTIEPGAMLFRGTVITPAGEHLRLSERAAYGVVVNPFDTQALWVYDQAGGYIGTAPRKARANLLDAAAVTPQLGMRAHDIAAMTAPLKERHADISSTLAEIRAHNDRVISGGAQRKQDARLARLADDAADRAAKTSAARELTTINPEDYDPID
jgi:hypothetical protein